jgi:hypothetical protein
MAFSSGTYTLPGAALNTGDTVSATENNTLRNDMASSFNLTWLRNGTAAATANIPMGGFELTNAAAIGSNSSLLLKSNSGTTAVTIDGSQNVGVGVTPSAWSGVTAFQNKSASIAVTTNGNNMDLATNRYNNGTSDLFYQTGNYALMYEQASGSGAHRWFTSTATGTAGNAITFTQAMTLDASGNLLVGTTTAGAGWGAGGKITADMTSSYTVLKSTNGASSPELLCWSATGTSDNSFVLFATETGGTTRGSIDYNRAGGLTRYNTTSDATLKNIIGDADGAKSVDILKSTRIREYSWKNDEANKPQIGVIAQELHETFKGAVSVGGDRTEVDEDGNEITRYAPWAVDKTAFTFHLIAGWQAHEKIIQEQQALITSLTERITALEAK